MPSRIVIVGAGFVGLPAARRIKRALGNRASVTVIDEKDHFLFTPRLIDALAGDVKEDQIKTDLALIADQNDFQFIKARVVSVDRRDRIVRFRKDPYGNGIPKELAYDCLILSEGAQVCYFDTPGSRHNTFCLKRIEDVYQIHDRIHHVMMQAENAKNAKEKNDLLSIVVIGGGASGVESLVAIKRYAERHIEEHAPHLAKHLSFSLVQAGPQILNGFPLSIVHGAMKMLRRHGVTVHVGEAVSCVEATCVTMDQRRPIPAGLTIWAAGIMPNQIPVQPEVHRDARGNLIIDHFLRVEPRIFAAGDTTTYAEQNVTVPKNGQTAFLMSGVIAENVIRFIRKEPPVPFRYHAAGSILWFGETAFADLKWFSMHSPLIVKLRDTLYRYRNWQITRR